MKLIINADDFGLTNGVTYGIYDSIVNGIVTSTTMMVTTSASQLAADLIKEHPNLNVGLHFNLSLGQPLTNSKSLTNDKNYFIKPKMMIDDSQYDENEIYEELKAQYDKFITLVGRKPTHIDSHLYIHEKFMKVNRQVIKFSEEINIPVRGFETKNFSKTIFEKNFKVLKDETYETLLEKFKFLVKENLNHEIVELMVHPGFIDNELLDISSYSQLRNLENQVLQSDEAKNFLLENNIKLISFKDVKGANNG